MVWTVIKDVFSRVSDTIKGHRKKRIEELYIPVYDELSEIEGDLLSYKNEYSFIWDEMRGSEKRYASREFTEKLDNLSLDIQDFQEVNNELRAAIENEMEGTDIQVNPSFPEEMLDEIGDRSRIILEREINEGKIRPVDFIYDIKWLFLFGYPLLHCESAEEIPQALRSYARVHNLEGFLNIEEWNARCPNWYEELWESKNLPVRTVWDVLYEYEEQFEARETRWEDVANHAKEVNETIGPRLDSVPIRILNRLKSWKAKLSPPEDVSEEESVEKWDLEAVLEENTKDELKEEDLEVDYEFEEQ